MAVAVRKAGEDKRVRFSVRKTGVQLVEFSIEGTVMSPDELRYVEMPQIDPSLPTVLSGRGPLWLYAKMIHDIHFVRILATFEPRLNKGVIISAPDKNLVGKAIDIETGEVTDARLGARGEVIVSLKKYTDQKYGEIQIIDVRIVGDSFAEPSTLSRISLPGVDWSKPVVMFGQMPVWLASHIASEYSNRSPWFGVYDPRLKGAVIAARHSKDAPEIGSVVPIDATKIEAQRRTKIVAVVGDLNSGKSVFLHLLSDSLRRQGKMVLTQEGDVVAPTQHWSLYSPELRAQIKQESYRSAEERLVWIVNSLRNAREANANDFILVDLGGGRPDLGVRITSENLAIMQHVDYVIIVSRDQQSIEAWEREIREKTPHIKILARLVSRFNQSGEYDFSEKDAVWHLDRKAYTERKIPEQTVKKVDEIASLLSAL